MFSTNSNYPNLFVLGAPKCGTTTMHAWLEQHPNIFSPSIKEPNYFNSDEITTASCSRSQFIKLYNPSGQNHVYKLDCTPWYLYSEKAIENILKTVSSPKFIVMIRRHSSMAISLHNEELNAGNENESDFEVAWNLSGERRHGLSIPAGCESSRRIIYTDACAVGQQIERLLRQVPKESVLFINLQELIDRPHDVCMRCWEFLDLPPVDSMTLTSKNARSEWRFKYLYHVSRIYRIIKRKLGVTTSFGLLEKYGKKGKARAGVNTQLVEKIDEYFQEDRRLVKLYTGIDLLCSSSSRRVD